ncbi:MAG: hypothetical protein HGA67_02800 [Candidatus Yonathbacteria bacterium]|nr:hypothetical protein [Candidatus Yonathbacteria bacterium]
MSSSPEKHTVEASPAELSLTGDSIQATYEGRTYQVKLPPKLDYVLFREKLRKAVEEAGSADALIAQYYSDRPSNEKAFFLDPNPETNIHAGENIVNAHAVWLMDLVKGVLVTEITPPYLD